ncbi:ATP-binding cassette domain-containing protein [Neoaquamicrobium sediminum]|uniref:ATP-binding cassette domain-containing protein n=1 Tax=Neoaquamicrobium sediminum TaxID=1849104 RepID=UPI0015639CDC|nr:ABC transporter ATP-binding protein [Mesorhizobium sediminum]NRC57221.1 ABC transporter ATP-binding protein [Mesorhizobium sediminum]
MIAADTRLLDVQGLTVAFGDTHVLHGVSFSLDRNEVLGIVGETGAGKSVLARALMNLLPSGARIVGGDVKVSGRSVFSLSEEDARKFRGGTVSLIGTNAKALLDPVQTVGSQVARVLQAHRSCSRREAREETRKLFEQVGIVNPKRRMEAYPHELSGGMAQRIVIAMALVTQPDIVLADDATLGLDATIQVQVLDLFVNRCRDLGLGAVIITHDLGIVAHYCDRIAIMKEGRIVELKPVGDFIAKPEAQYSAVLLDAAKVRPTPMTTQAEKGRGADNGDAILRVENLFKYFPLSGGEVVKAVDDVSFSLNRHETLALVGESGSGKTTVGQCLVKLLGTDQGRILFDGEDTVPLTEKEFRPLRRRMQMVFQEPYVALNPRWMVADLLSEPLRLEIGMSNTDRASRVRELLDLVRLPSKLAHAYPHELTAGEQKRVGIARALATKPEFVVFDEPTTALDIRVRAQIIDLVRDLQREIGLSALFITHDLNSVRSLAHYVAVMRLGKIVEMGETEAIFASPAQEYTQKLLAAELPIEQSAAQKIRATDRQNALGAAR